MNMDADIEKAHRAIFDLKTKVVQLKRRGRHLIWITFMMLLLGVAEAWFLRRSPGWQIYDIIIALLAYGVRYALLRKAWIYECARRNFELLIRHQGNPTAVEHHFDQAMAALERL